MNEAGTVLRSAFPTTIWSEVGRAGRADGEEAVAALGRLLPKYYHPLQVHLQAKFRVDANQSADWLQDFIRQKVLLGQLLAKASRNRGRFRTFLLNTLDNFVSSELRRTYSQKRHPSGGLVAMDDTAVGDDAASQAARDAFEANWARAVVVQTVEAMEAECVEKGRPERWGVFKARLLDPMLEGSETPAYAELVARFGFKSPSEASNALVTAKRRFDRILRQVVAEYTGEGADVECEIRELMRALSGA